MNRKLVINVFPILALLAISFAMPGCRTVTPGGCTTSTGDSPITHFRWIDQGWGICASGQPDAKGFAWLSVQPAGLGGQFMGTVNHIIKLNSDSEGSDKSASLLYGFDLDYNPISLDWQINPLHHEALDRYMHECLHLLRPGTLVHCSLGDDRTGAFIYAYRRNTGWTDAQARAELMTNGFHTSLLGLAYFVDHYQPVLGEGCKFKMLRTNQP
jgi:hypothetical protein